MERVHLACAVAEPQMGNADLLLWVGLHRLLWLQLHLKWTFLLPALASE